MGFFLSLTSEGLAGRLKCPPAPLWRVARRVARSEPIMENTATQGLQGQFRVQVQNLE